MPIVLLYYKTDVIDVRFSFGDDLFDRNNSRKARIWFAFPPKSDGSLLTGGEAWNIAVLSGTRRIANANCLLAIIQHCLMPLVFSTHLRNIFLVPTLQSRNFIFELFKFRNVYHVLQKLLTYLFCRNGIL